METRRLRTDRLDIAYLAHGPADGPAALLLHGFPDDATAWTAVMERLGARGHRCIAPYARGCGGERGTRFLRDDTPRAGDFPALGNDALALVDALDLRDLVVVGQDWGSPVAEIVAMMRPDRVRQLVKLNWYGVYSMLELSRAQGFGWAQLRALWYVWMLNLPLGEMVLQYDSVGFARALWAEWSPSWAAAERDAALDSALPSLVGDDWRRVALAAYRAGTSPAETDPADDALRVRLQDPPPVSCATHILTGADDGVERTPLTPEQLARWFPAGAHSEALRGVGHWPHRERPDAVIAAVLA
ncbi:MAG TPA: alpha/beta hydrolase [Gemmatimonadaceae bacterium]|nr:alpha/beta hydrolase [Gemmatimonadaceae bacterium]